MLDDYGFEVYEENAFSCAYLLTFRTFGTWLHGDERPSYGRTRNGPYGIKQIDMNVPVREAMRSEMSQPPKIIDCVARPYLR